MGTGVRLSDRFKALRDLKADSGQDAEESMISFSDLLEVTLEVTIDPLKKGRGAKHKRKSNVPSTCLHKLSCHNTPGKRKTKPKPLQNVTSKSSKQKFKKRNAGAKHQQSKSVSRAGTSQQTKGSSSVPPKDGVTHSSAKGISATVIDSRKNTNTAPSHNIPSKRKSRLGDPCLTNGNESCLTTKAHVSSASDLDSKLQYQESRVFGVLADKTGDPDCLRSSITADGINTDKVAQDCVVASTEDVNTHTIDNPRDAGKAKGSAERPTCETFIEAITTDNNKRSDEILDTMPGKGEVHDAAKTVEKGISKDNIKSCAGNSSAEISTRAENDKKYSFATDHDVKEKFDGIRCAKTARAPAAVGKGLSEKDFANKTTQLKEISGKDDATLNDDRMMTENAEEIFCSKSAQTKAHAVEDTLDEDNDNATGKMNEHSKMTSAFEITEENAVAVKNNMIETSEVLDTIRDITDDGREETQEDTMLHDSRPCTMTEIPNLTPAQSHLAGKNSRAVDFSNMEKQNDQLQCALQSTVQCCTFPDLKASLKQRSTNPNLERCKQETEKSCVSDEKSTLKEENNILVYDSVKSDESHDTLERSVPLVSTFSEEQSADDMQQLHLTVISSLVEDQVSLCPLTQVAPDGLQIAVDSGPSPTQLQTEPDNVLFVSKKELNRVKDEDTGKDLPEEVSVGSSDISDNTDGHTKCDISMLPQSCASSNLAVKGSSRFVDKTPAIDIMAETTSNTQSPVVPFSLRQNLQSVCGSTNTATQSSSSPVNTVSIRAQAVTMMPDGSHSDDEVCHMNTSETYRGLTREGLGNRPLVYTSVSRVPEQFSHESDRINQTPKSSVGEHDEVSEQHISVLQGNSSICYESSRCVGNHMTENSKGDIRLHKCMLLTMDERESQQNADAFCQANRDVGKLQLKLPEHSPRVELDNLDVVDMDISPSSSQSTLEWFSDDRLELASINTSVCPDSNKRDVGFFPTQSQECTQHRSPGMEEVVCEQQKGHEKGQSTTAYSEEEMACLPQNKENHAPGVPASQMDGICEVKPSVTVKQMTRSSVDRKEFGTYENVGLSSSDDNANDLAQNGARTQIPIILSTYSKNQRTNRHEDIPEKTEAVCNLSGVESIKSTSDCTTKSDTSQLDATLPYGTDEQKMALLFDRNDDSNYHNVECRKKTNELSSLCSEKNQKQAYVSNASVNAEERLLSVCSDRSQQSSDLSVPVSELMNKSRSYTKGDIVDCREDNDQLSDHLSVVDSDEMDCRSMRKCHIQKLPYQGVIAKQSSLPDNCWFSEDQGILKVNSEKVAAVQAIQFQISTAVNPTHRAALELALEALMTSVMRHPNDGVYDAGKTNISGRAQRSPRGQSVEKSPHVTTQGAEVHEAKNDTGENAAHSICAVENDMYQASSSAPPDNSEVSTEVRSPKGEEDHVNQWQTSKKPKRSIKYFHGRPLIKDRSNATDPYPIPLNSDDVVSSIYDPRRFVGPYPIKELKPLKWRSSRSKKRKGRHSKNVFQVDNSHKGSKRRRINESEGSTQDTGRKKEVSSHSFCMKPSVIGPSQNSCKSENHKLQEKQTLYASVSAGNLVSDDTNGSYYKHVSSKEDGSSAHSENIVKECDGVNRDMLPWEGTQISDMKNESCRTGESVEVSLGKRTRAEESTRSKSPHHRSQSNVDTSQSDESRRESKMKHHSEKSSDETSEPPRKVKRSGPHSRSSRKHRRSKSMPLTHSYDSHGVMFNKRGIMCPGSLEKPYSSHMYVRRASRGRGKSRSRRTYLHNNQLRKDRFQDPKDDESTSLLESLEEHGFPSMVPWTDIHAALHDIKSQMLSMEKSPKEVNKFKAMELIHPLLEIRDATISALKRINEAVRGMESQTTSEIHLHRQKYEILMADIRIHAEVLSNLLSPHEAKKVMAGFMDNATGIPFVDSTVESHVLKCLRQQGSSAMPYACMDLIESKLANLHMSKPTSWRSKSFSDIDDSYYPLSSGTDRHVDGLNSRSERACSAVCAASPASLSCPEMVAATQTTLVTESFDQSSELRPASDSATHKTCKPKDWPTSVFKDPTESHKFSRDADHVSRFVALGCVSGVEESCAGDTKKTLTTSESTRDGDLCDTLRRVPDISMHSNTISPSPPHNPDSSHKAKNFIARAQERDFRSRLCSDSEVDVQRLMGNDYQRNSDGLWTPRSPVGSSDSCSQTKRIKSRSKSLWFKTSLKKKCDGSLSLMYDEYDESCTTSQE
ncbi:uncharacterized protein [Diadema setosum]|uniref:uncharacterized protein n=1 Tax=Diadema setosum TaxID=31175 RepID=UPI003B3A3836